MFKITSILARQIFDSRGYPTVEVEVGLADGAKGMASVPSGASTGTHEALELRDGGEDYAGKGVIKAVGHVNQEISTQFLNQEFSSLAQVDDALRALDGTDNFGNLGANATLGFSLAVAKAMATSLKLPLFKFVNQVFSELMGEQIQLAMPRPMINVFNGGAHTDWQTTDIQEFMLIPSAKTSYPEQLKIGMEIYQALKKILIETGFSVGVGDEGGFAPKVKNNTEAIDLIMKAISATKYQPGVDVEIGLDAAASEWFKDGQYVMPLEKRTVTTQELISYWLEWIGKYPIATLEDGLAEDDWQGWAQLTPQLGKVLSVGDDLLVTNSARISQAIEQKACDTLLAKVNQIGTLTDALKAISLAKKAGWQIVVSHRSGETEDNYIADIAVGVGAQFIKSGGMSRSERMSKYNQLLRIDQQLG